MRARTYCRVAAIVVTVLAGAAQAQDASALLPIEAGMPLYTRHGSHNSGPGAWESNTVGAYALWDAGELGPFKMRASAVAMRLSTGRIGYGAGGMAEYGHLYASLTLMRGYQRVHYGMEQLPGSTLDCTPRFCAWRSAQDRWVLVPSIGVRIDLPGKFVARVQLQPKPGLAANAHYYADRRDARTDWSVLLSVGRTF